MNDIPSGSFIGGYIDTDTALRLFRAAKADAALSSRWRLKDVLALTAHAAVFDAESIDGSNCVIKATLLPSGDAFEQKMAALGYSGTQSKKLAESFNANASREALVLGSLSESGAVPVMYDYGHFPVAGDGECFYICMEKLRQIPASAASAAEAADITAQLCLALGKTHDKGIIHRDLKPSNCFLAPGGCKIGDFGVSRIFGAAMNATVTGTPEYMAPELLRAYGRETHCVYDKTVDIYSLGLILYSLLNNGRIPFLETDAPSQHELKKACLRRASGEPFPAPKICEPQLTRIIDRACTVEPKKRYPTAQDMYEALVLFRSALRKSGK